MTEEEYHFYNDTNKKREIWSMIGPVIREIEDKYGLDYLVGLHLAGIKGYVMSRGIKEMSTPISDDKELVIRVVRVKKEGV